MRALVIQGRHGEGINVTDVLIDEGFIVDQLDEIVDQLDEPSAAGLLDDQIYSIGVIDLDTPGFDALNLLRQWKSHERHFPVLAVSATGGWLAKIAAMEAGADDYLVKPIIFRTLLQKIHSIISLAS